ncbi:MAG: sigma-70 family RNA polymerase sigma factor [Bacteroidales bacterium]|nr:sigma-70 family RNA polymerase sigma factor [Bacteroidales bacterium]
MTDREYHQAVDTYSSNAYRFALSYSSNRPLCEDVVQDAYLALWEQRERIPMEKARAYLFTVVYHKLMSALRHQTVVNHSAVDMAQSQPIHTTPSVEFDLADILQRAMQVLPPVQRAILQLRDVEDMSYKEIANTLKLSDQQVQVYLFRARVAMKKQLKLWGYDHA